VVIAGNQIVLDGPRDMVLNQLKQPAVTTPAAEMARQIARPDASPAA
jgi:hypothetical protein